MLKVIRRPMFNQPERAEYYLALEDFAEVPMPTPRCKTREELIAVLEHYLDVARNGDVVEVK